MSRRCCIAICSNSRTDANEGISYHPFPVRTELRNKWIEFVGADQAKFRWRSKSICSAHFLSSEFCTTSGKRTLQNDAIPMIYSPDDFKDEECDNTEVISEDILGVDSEIVEVKMEAIEASDLELRTQFCRICIKKNNHLIPLDSKLHNIPVIDAINTVTGLEITPDDQLPNMICSSCVEKVDVAYNVYIEFNNYASILEQMIQNNQLENHYKYYDQHRLQSPTSHNHDYINALMKSVKGGQELYKAGKARISPRVNTPSTYMQIVAATETKNASVEDDGTMVEGLYAEEYIDDESIDEVIEAKSLPEITKRKSTKRKKNEQVQVFSWKELYKPKPKPKNTIVNKITQILPAPELVPNTCYVCDPHSSYPDPEALNQHLEGHITLLPFTCADCHTDKYPAVFRTLVALNRHLMVHLYPYKCDYCWQRSISLNAYKGHIYNMHQSRTGDGFTCETCGTQFGTRRAFRLHVNKHRALEDERYKCRHCGKLFAYLKLLTRHERIHTGEKPFECNKCDKRFNHAYNYQLHIRRHTGEKAYFCEECGKSFFDATLLKGHMAVHFPNDPRYRKKPKSSLNVGDSKQQVPREYRCTFEGCDFVSSSYMTAYNHRNKHTRPYSCHVCAKTFATSQRQKYHIKMVHEGFVPEKKFQCSYCAKSFINNAKLVEHVNVHENNRPFKCQYCAKTFVQKINCAAHERIHTGDRPHQCRFCDEKFISTSARKKHEMRYHPGKTPATENSVEVLETDTDQLL